MGMTSMNDPHEELKQYVGFPKCQDCGWKLGSDITNHCSCNTANRDDEKHQKAFARARELQKLTMNDDLLPILPPVNPEVVPPEALKLPENYDTALLGATVSIHGADKFAYSLRALIEIVMLERGVQPPEARQIILAEFIKPYADEIAWINDELVAPVEVEESKIIIPKKVGKGRWRA